MILWWIDNSKEQYLLEILHHIVYLYYLTKRVQIIFCLLHIIFTWIWSLGNGRISFFFAFYISIKLSKMCAFLSETEYVDGTTVPEQHTSFSHLDACAFITLSLTAVLTGTQKNIGSKTWISHLLSNLYWMIFRYNTLMGVSSNMGTFDPDDFYKRNSLTFKITFYNFILFFYISNVPTMSNIQAS